MYSWKDPRIEVNTSHPYWKGRGNERRKSVRLNGKFVEECLWTPQVQFFGNLVDVLDLLRGGGHLAPVIHGFKNGRSQIHHPGVPVFHGILQGILRNELDLEI